MKKKTKNTCKSTVLLFPINILLVLSCVCLDEKHTTEHQKRPSQNMVIHTKKYGTLYQKNMVNCTIKFMVTCTTEINGQRQRFCGALHQIFFCVLHHKF